MNPIPQMSLIRLRRRRFFALAAAGTAGGAVTLGAGACSSPSTSSTTASSTPPVPDGWARATAGHAAFTMPENCQQVPLPDDAPLGYWDWVAQDSPTLDDTSVTYRIGVITQGPSAVFDNPPTDDTEFVARKLGVSSLFGRKMLSTGASPYQVEGIPDQLWRIDYFPIGGSADSSEDKNYLFVAQDDGEPEIIVIGLTGLTITEDFLTTFISGIEVLHD